MPITMHQAADLTRALIAAEAAGHPWPGAAAAESALESAWFSSQSCLNHRNILGIKAPSWWTGPKFALATREVVDGNSVVDPNAVWAEFESWRQCFETQLEIFRRNPKTYAATMNASSPEEYIMAESAKWATDPQRGAKVLSIYRSHQDVLGYQSKPKTKPQELA